MAIFQAGKPPSSAAERPCRGRLPRLSLYLVSFLADWERVRFRRCASRIALNHADTREISMTRSVAVLTLIAALAATVTAVSAQSRVQSGVLECRGAPTASFVVGSAHQLECTFQSDHGAQYRYYGVLNRAGLDIGFTERSVFSWAVLAPTERVGPGDLAGTYGGVTAGAAVGVGGNANALVGGSANSFALQPLTLEGQTGLNVAVGAVELELRPADEGGPPRRMRRAHLHHRHHPRSHHAAM
jgi:Protein of unknown function (DUF992)